MKPLSAKQKAVICQLARRTYDRLRSKGQLVGIDFDTWRRDEIERAVGKHGLRACSNADYLPLKSHFEDLLGNPDSAFETLVRQSGDKRRQAEAALVAAMERANYVPAQVNRICRDRFKCDVSDATVPQLHQLIMTVKQRAKNAAVRRTAVRRTESASTLQPF